MNASNTQDTHPAASKSTAGNSRASTVRKRPAAKKTKRKVKRKLHKGRLAIVLTPLVLIILLVMILFSNYGNPGEIYRAYTDRELHVTEATEAGRRDAERVLHTADGSMDRDAALLYIHSRASALRLNGYESAADDYMTGATELLRSRHIIE